MSNPETTPAPAAERIDPTTFAVLQRSLKTLAMEMSATLAKVAYSPVVTEGMDFAGALFNHRGELVCCGDRDLPGLMGTLEPTIELILEQFPREQFRAGDVFVTNAAHEAGSHLNDVRFAKPLFADGELVAFVANVAHWTDIGGATPGSVNPVARDSFSEGLRITPVKLVDRGELREDVLRLLLANVRLPYESNGDAWAQMKALDTGEARFHDLLRRFGAPTVVGSFDRILDHGEAMFLSTLAGMPDGTVEFSDYIDMDPLDPELRPVKVHLELTKAGRRLTFDFRGSDPQPMGGIGCTRPLTQSAVYVATLNLFPDVPFNHGFIRNVEIVTDPGTAVHAVMPAPVSGAAAGGYEKAIGCVLGCIGKLVPERQVGCTFNLINAMLGGHDPRFDRPFVMYMWNEGGFGGGPDQDGGDQPTQSLFATGSRNQPIEVHERFYPVRFTKLEIAEDSAGAGQWRGCPGISHAYEVIAGDPVLGTFGDRKVNRPWGVRGGEPGWAQNCFVNPGTDGERELGLATSGVQLHTGDVVEIRSGGGGGYGDPFERDPALVVRDVTLGFVSPDAARTTYGVAVNLVDDLGGVWAVDVDTTHTLRAVAARREENPA
ncbi:MAG: N-methylhydantoinase [Solirubrobacteraceae bacterium]|nr:N-methylhydantoinase [Solirubrobacteraceae bacterium]